MKFVLASHNRGKLKEMQEILAELGVEVALQSDVGLDLEPEENGSTFAENAAIKAKAVMEASGLPAIADDSGLCVDALNGAPGIYSARFSGVHGDDKANNRVLLQKMQGVEDRSAHFTCAMVLVRPDGSVVRAEGRMDGVIAHEEAGIYGFGYDSLFYLPERGCTNAQLLPEEKNAVSHRAKASEKMRQIMAEISGQGN